MKIAWCFYGQPRKLELGHKNIDSYLKKFDYKDVDFFCHAWYNDNSFINQSPWSIKREGQLKITKDFLNKIIEIYNPKKYLFEKENKFEKCIEELENSLINKTNNVANVLSGCYSTQKTVELLKDYAIENNINYDFVFVSRYDFLKPIELNINSVSNKYMYSTDIHIKTNRIIPSPALLCGGFYIINKIYSNLFSNIFLYKNDENTKKFIEENLKEKFYVNHEEVLLCNIFFNGANILNDVKFTNNIPNFI